MPAIQYERRRASNARAARVRKAQEAKLAATGAQREEAFKFLTEILSPGDTLYVVLMKAASRRSPSSILRAVQILALRKTFVTSSKPDKIEIANVTTAIATVLGYDLTRDLSMLIRSEKLSNGEINNSLDGLLTRKLTNALWPAGRILDRGSLRYQWL